MYEFEDVPTLVLTREQELPPLNSPLWKELYEELRQ